MKLKYLKELDGVRAIAALMVMFFHFFQSISTTDSKLLIIQKIAIFGQTGVSLFFVLSGFLITRILIATKKSHDYFYNFYVRRILRIFPLYYLFLIIYFFIMPLLFNNSIADFRYQIYHWVYLQDFAMTFNWPLTGPEHFWSLAVEEHFYLFWPFLIYYLNKQKITISVLILVIMSLFVRIYLTNLKLEVYYFTFSRMDELAIGALLAILEVDNQLTNKNSNKFSLLFILLIIPTIIIWVNNNSSGNSTLQIFKFILLSLIYFSLIGYIITVNGNNIFKRLFQAKPFLFTGKISYGLYVYHPLCYWLFNHFFETRYIILNFIGCFISAYATAAISYYLFESQFLNLKKYFEYNKKKILITDKS